MQNPYTPQFKLRNTEPEIRPVDLDDYLRVLNSPLWGLGGFIKDCAECFKINELFILAVIGLESMWGKSRIARVKNNLMGWGAVDDDPLEKAWDFHTLQGSIMTACHHLDRSYLTRHGKFYKDGTIDGVGRFYSSDREWANKIVRIMSHAREFFEKRDRQEKL